MIHWDCATVKRLEKVLARHIDLWSIQCYVEAEGQEAAAPHLLLGY